MDNYLERHFTPISDVPEGALVKTLYPLLGYKLSRNGIPISDEVETEEQVFFLQTSLFGKCLIGIFGFNKPPIDYLVRDSDLIEVVWIPEEV